MRTAFVHTWKFAPWPGELFESGTGHRVILCFLQYTAAVVPNHCRSRPELSGLALRLSFFFFGCTSLKIISNCNLHFRFWLNSNCIHKNVYQTARIARLSIILIIFWNLLVNHLLETTKYVIYSLHIYTNIHTSILFWFNYCVYIDISMLNFYERKQGGTWKLVLAKLSGICMTPRPGLYL